VTRAWRLVKKRHEKTAFDGEGARLYGGRWNDKGVAVVYVAGTLALAALETFVHLTTHAMSIKFVAFELEIPPTVAIEAVSALPPDWRAEPAPASTRAIGTTWIHSATSAVLQVPSVVVPQEPNFVLNPTHADFKYIKIGAPVAFDFDPRMWK